MEKRNRNEKKISDSCTAVLERGVSFEMGERGENSTRDSKSLKD
jgi:hypothetical protein